jgi:hypothetical protein
MSEVMKKCKECQTDIPQNAKRCPNCTADQRSWAARHPILVVLLVVIGIPFVIGVTSDTTTTPTAATTPENFTVPDNGAGETPVSSAPATPAEPVSTWKYQTKTDEFSGIAQYFASTLSTNTLEFDFPYNGGSRFTLSVRDMNNGKGEEVIIITDKGQFMTYEEQIKVRFDDGEPIAYTISGSQDGSANAIFIRNGAGFIANLKGSSEIKVEAPFYQEGRKVIYFTTTGFDGLKKE